MKKAVEKISFRVLTTMLVFVALTITFGLLGICVWVLRAAAGAVGLPAWAPAAGIAVMSVFMAVVGEKEETKG